MYEKRYGKSDWIMRHIIKQKELISIEPIRQQAIENSLKFIACQISMDVMGVARKELLEEVTIGDVATYMERAKGANVNLFV